MKISEHLIPIAFVIKQLKEIKGPLKAPKIKAVSFEAGYPLEWAVYDDNGNRLNKTTGNFDHEMLPSNRTDEWIKRHTFLHLKEALECYQKHYN
jgi:hypothetical protein